MKIAPIAGPMPAGFGTGDAQAAQASRERAISRLVEQPVQNANQVQPEEMMAIKAKEPTEVLETVGQNDTNETPVEAPLEQEAKKTAKEDALSTQYAQLARRERAMRIKAQQQEQAIRTREAAIAARESELAGKDQTYQSSYISKDQFKSNPLQALAEAGVSYEELTQQILNQQPTDPRIEATIRSMQAKIDKMEAEAQKSQKSYQDQQTEAYNAAVRQIKADATNLVKQDPAFETIKATNSVNDVVDLIERHFKKYNQVLSVEDAAQQVEDYLVEEAMKLTRIQKIKSRLNLPAQGSKAAIKEQQPTNPKQQQMTTLTNSVGSKRQLSAKERAVMAFKGQLE